MSVKKMFAVLFCLFTLIVPVGCGNSTDSSSDDLTISILNKTFIPDSITANPGDTIQFLNQDSVSHQILNESGENQFDDTELFDSDIILSGFSGEITIPEDVTSGTLLYFYSALFTSDMITPNGQITIE